MAPDEMVVVENRMGRGVTRGWHDDDDEAGQVWGGLWLWTTGMIYIFPIKYIVDEYDLMWNAHRCAGVSNLRYVDPE